ncbi:MAG: hypothetical protein WBL45_09275 [Solirubrobacterales bacterium]
MSAAPPTTTFTSRGRLSGVVRQQPLGGVRGGTDDLDTQAYEAIYYRARLILGDTLPRPDRLRAKGPLGD